MTIPLDFDGYVRRFLAQKLGDITSGQIVEFRFEADPGRVWSDDTEESFDCHIIVTVDQMGQDRERHVFLNKTETCEFLNGYASVREVCS